MDENLVKILTASAVTALTAIAITAILWRKRLEDKEDAAIEKTISNLQIEVVIKTHAIDILVSRMRDLEHPVELEELFHQAVDQYNAKLKGKPDEQADNEVT